MCACGLPVPSPFPLDCMQNHLLMITPLHLPSPPSPSDATAVIPVQGSVEVILGSTAELNIYAEGDPPLASNEIEWERSDGTQVLNDTRVFLHDSNYRLVIQNVTLQDSGVYRIEIVRESAPASTTIDLDVQGKFGTSNGGQPLNKQLSHPYTSEKRTTSIYKGQRNFTP